MNEEIKKLKKEIEELKQWKQAMSASSTIPLQNDQAIRERFLNPLVKQGEKSATSENQLLIQEGTNVLLAPDGFDRRFDKEIQQYKYYAWYNLA